MNLDLLANLLYPNIKKTPADIEKQYPSRNLLPGQEVTRIAPSPTGYMHIGNFFSAFLDWQIARSTNGVFFFRLEDTDKKREIEGSGLVAINMLESYGISPHEGLTIDGSEKGSYGPYVQSKRLEIYHTYAKDLVKKGKAFPCFCEKTESFEEILQKREKALETENEIEDKDPCRLLNFEQISNLLSQGKKFAIRLKSEGKEGEKIETEDVVRGTRTLARNSKDLILIKNDGIPPYAFAHAVDDYLMKTTTVVRGEEWYASYPGHIEIFEALGFERPKYLHTPIILKIDEETGNKRKLSKRKDPEADMRYFSQKGYPKQAVLEYLLTLANSNYEIWKLNNPEKSFMDFEFSATKVGSSNPLFDLVKLSDIAKNYIATLSKEEVYENLLTYTKEYDQEFYQILTANKAYAISVFGIDRGGPKPRKDFAKWEDFKQFFDYMFNIKDLTKKENFELEGINQNKVFEIVSAYQSVYNAQDDKQQWFDKIKDMSGSLGYATDNKLYKQNPEMFKGNVADVCLYIRLALTGQQSSPDLHAISQTLGQKEVEKRLANLKTILEN